MVSAMGGTYLWVQQDADYNVTALVDNSGAVVERYADLPYGTFSVYDANWNPRSSSAYNFVYQHQGLRFDQVSTVYIDRGRIYDASLGRFLQVDPMGFAAGDVDLYRAEGDGPINGLDPSGTIALPGLGRGTWIQGSRGNGIFQYSDTKLNRALGLAGMRVAFRNNSIAIGGFPAEWYWGGSAAAASVPIQTVTGTSADFTAADEAMRTKLNDPNWSKPEGYTWNHAGDSSSKTMELIKRDPHARVHHQGSAAAPRAAARQACKVKALGAAGKSIAALTVYLTLRDAAQAAGMLPIDYVPDNAPYYFVGSDGSVFTVDDTSWYNFWSNPKRNYVAGPRSGQTEDITAADVESYKNEAEAVWGKFVPGNLFRDPIFIPGTQRSELPLTDEFGMPKGWIDQYGPHEYGFRKNGLIPS
jgi:RHS repeat-associated protein